MLNKNQKTYNRNIGIAAHVDSGKTTLTEWIVKKGGLKKEVGAVHDGNTKTDYMKQERERGITIVSAAIYINYEFLGDNYGLNIIDTPGHVDFKMEVIVTLKSFDGMILVISASDFVETQMESVFQLAMDNNVSAVFFINKMDKVGADFHEAVKSLREKISIGCIPLFYPKFHGYKFIGAYSLIDRTRNIDININERVITQFEDLDKSEKEIISQQRNIMIERIIEIDNDEKFMQDYLNHGENYFSADFLNNKITELTRKNIMFPVALGSAYHVKNVADVLHIAIRYLKRPEDNESEIYNVKKDQILVPKQIPKEHTVALVFKYGRFGATTLRYVRVFSGTIETGATLFNSSSKKEVRIARICRLIADKQVTVSIAESGGIYGLIVNEVFIDNVLCTVGTYYKMKDDLLVPKPVIDVKMTPRTNRDATEFYKKIQQFLHEDRSLSLTSSADMDQDSQGGVLINHSNKESKGDIVISAIGKLQIEVLVDKLKECNINVDVGKPKVSYRESISKSAGKLYKHSKQTGGKGQFAVIELEVHPLSEEEKLDSNRNPRELIFTNLASGREIPKNYIDAIIKGLTKVLSYGIYGKPVIDVKWICKYGAHHPVDSSGYVFELVAHKLGLELLREAGPILLEPYFHLDITTPLEYIDNITGQIYSDRGNIENNKNIPGQNRSIIRALVPGKIISDYEDKLRTITKGKAGILRSNFSHYEKCSEDELLDDKV